MHFMKLWLKPFTAPLYVGSIPKTIYKKERERFFFSFSICPQHCPSYHNLSKHPSYCYRENDWKRIHVRSYMPCIYADTHTTIISIYNYKTVAFLGSNKHPKQFTVKIYLYKFYFQSIWWSHEPLPRYMKLWFSKSFHWICKELGKTILKWCEIKGKWITALPPSDV